MFGSKAATYAILTVAEIARRQADHRGGVQAAELARELHLPAAYAAKVMTQLARANVLRSDRGPRGGFRLARQPGEIDLLEVVEAVEGSLTAERDRFDQTMPVPTNLERVYRVFDDAVARLRERLRGQTVANLLTETTITVPDNDHERV